jgi:hypothetical protein
LTFAISHWCQFKTGRVQTAVSPGCDKGQPKFFIEIVVGFEPDYVYVQTKKHVFLKNIRHLIKEGWKAAARADLGSDYRKTRTGDRHECEKVTIPMPLPPPSRSF